MTSRHTDFKTADTRVLQPHTRVTEESGLTFPSPDQPGEFVASGSPGASSLKRLDAIVHTGERLAKAVDVVSREELRALADRFELNPNEASSVLRIQVKRRLLGAHGLVRASRAK